MRLGIRMLAVLAVVVVAGAASAGADAPSGDGRVLLLPFLQTGETQEGQWIGKAMQQNMLNELSRAGGLDVMVNEGGGVGDPEQARKAAADRGARFVVFGSYQMSAGMVRVTGQVLDTKTNKYVGAMKGTGTQRDLFLIEDTVAEQAKRALLATLKAEGVTTPADALKNVATLAPPVRRLPPVAQAVQYPWHRDMGEIADARRRLRMDDEYDRAYVNRNYYGRYYDDYYWGYPYFVSGHWHHRHHHHHHHRRISVFPGGYAVGRLKWFPGGVINLGW